MYSISLIMGAIGFAIVLSGINPRRPTWIITTGSAIFIIANILFVISNMGSTP